MAYRIEGKDIVIDGFETGISDNPYKGLNDITGLNIISIPGEASVGFAQTNNIFSPLALTIISADAGTDVITCTVQTGALDLVNNGQAINFTGGSLPAGISANTTYWIQASSPTTFQIFSDYPQSSLVNITGTGTGSGGSIDIGEIRYFDKNNPFGIDINGRVWTTAFGGVGTNWVYTGNTVGTAGGASPSNGNGICMFTGTDLKQWLFAFRNGSMDYLNVTTSTWVYGWVPSSGGASITTNTLNTPFGTNNLHEALIGISDGKMYVADGNYIVSLSENNGQTFDPTNTATYSFAKQAITIPKNDTVQCITELGQYFLIGGNFNIIYTWDRLKTNLGNAILITDNGITRMLTVNTNAYIFTGKRGRIYVTNGSQAQFYMKIPDQISGVIDPAITFKGVAYNKNQLYFGISATNNAGSAINLYTGVWAVDVTTNALRRAIVPSGTNATVTSIYVNQSSTTGYGLAVAWKNASGYGIDSATNTPYSTYQSYIISDMINIGQFLTKRTLTNVEFKLSYPLISGEGVKISYRTSFADTFHQIGETLTADIFSDTYLVNFDLSQWLQLKIELKSTASNPSYTRLFEVRLR